MAVIELNDQHDFHNGARTTVIDDLDALIDILPPHLSEPLRQQEDCSELLEVVMDLGRPPEARFFSRETILNPIEITEQDIEYVVSRISSFTTDNRAGMERTLHRISAIRSRKGSVVGLTCRVGRAVLGTVKLIEDLVESGQSILLLGRPGVGKTTMLREVARVLADDLRKRVIIVDTSNEIAGDGDIPHPAIGRARRMQVATPAQQHAVMIEAVENHMPEAIIIDEIGTELEAAAARTIAERGVQLIGTAHGNSLENLILNPTLADLVGGIQQVTLGDEEAQRRGTQKSVLERRAPPTFDVVVEIQGFGRVAVHADVSEAMDAILRGRTVTTEVRWLDDQQEVRTEVESSVVVGNSKDRSAVQQKGRTPCVYLFGLSRYKLEQAAKDMRLPLHISTELDDAEMVVTSKNHYQRKPQTLLDAEAAGIPIYVLKSNATSHIKRFLNTTIADTEKARATRVALEEAADAVTQVLNGKDCAELAPQNSYIRRLQHMLAKQHQLSSKSLGREPERRVEIYKGDDQIDIECSE